MILHFCSLNAHIFWPQKDSYVGMVCLGVEVTGVTFICNHRSHTALYVLVLLARNQYAQTVLCTRVNKAWSYLGCAYIVTLTRHNSVRPLAEAAWLLPLLHCTSACSCSLPRAFTCQHQVTKQRSRSGNQFIRKQIFFFPVSLVFRLSAGHSTQLQWH